MVNHKIGIIIGRINIRLSISKLSGRMKNEHRLNGIWRLRDYLMAMLHIMSNIFLFPFGIRVDTIILGKIIGNVNIHFEKHICYVGKE